LVKSPTSLRKASIPKTSSTEGKKRDSISSSKLPSRINRLSLKSDNSKTSNVSTLSEIRRKSVKADSLIMNHQKIEYGLKNSLSEELKKPVEIVKKDSTSKIGSIAKVTPVPEKIQEQSLVPGDNNPEDREYGKLVQEPVDESMLDDEILEENVNESLENELPVESSKILEEIEKEEIIKQEPESKLELEPEQESNLEPETKSKPEQELELEQEPELEPDPKQELDDPISNIEDSAVKDIIEETIREQRSLSIPTVNLDDVMII